MKNIGQQLIRVSLVLCFLSPAYLAAQKPHTYLSVEGAGTGINGSVNFGTPFLTHPNFKIFLQWGVGWAPEKSQSKHPINLPAQVFCTFGNKHLSFETGIGSTLIFESSLNKTELEKTTNEWYLSPLVGVRRESNNWFGRLYAGPMFHITGEEVFDDLTSTYLKLGIAFGVIF